MIRSIYIKSNLFFLLICTALISFGNKDYNKKMMQEISLSAIGNFQLSITTNGKARLLMHQHGNRLRYPATGNHKATMATTDMVFIGKT